MICDYGCGKEALYFFKNVNKWCCSCHYKKCPAQRKKMKGKNNPFYNKTHSLEFKTEHSKRMSIFMKNPKNNPMKKLSVVKKHIGKKMPLEAIVKIRNSQLGSNNSNYGNKRTISMIKNKYSLFSKIEEMRYNPNNPTEKEIQVHCKNHNCPNSKEQGGWFTPTGRQIESRIWAIENDDGNGGSYFYCCEVCKTQCPLYNLRSDPFKVSSNLYTNQEYNIWKQKVFKQDNYECQKCGSKENLHCHHIIPVKKEPMFSLDPDNGIVLCEKCHYEIGHKTGTECSTGSLANIICN